jgi:hypothetical protein
MGSVETLHERDLRIAKQDAVKKELAALKRIVRELADLPNMDEYTLSWVSFVLDKRG